MATSAIDGLMFEPSSAWDTITSTARPPGKPRWASGSTDLELPAWAGAVRHTDATTAAQAHSVMRIIGPLPRPTGLALAARLDNRK